MTVNALTQRQQRIARYWRLDEVRVGSVADSPTVGFIRWTWSNELGALGKTTTIMMVPAAADAIRLATTYQPTLARKRVSISEWVQPGRDESERTPRLVTRYVDATPPAHVMTAATQNILSTLIGVDLYAETSLALQFIRRVNEARARAMRS